MSRFRRIRRICNERGNASLYLIWFVFISGFLLVLLLNVLNLYGKKEQAAIAAEQAAIAGTDLLLEAVTRGVQDFDRSIVGIERMVQTGESMQTKLGNAKERFVRSGTPAPEAKVKAFNEVLENELSSTDPDLLAWKTELRDAIRRELDKTVDAELKPAVQSLINRNAGKLTADSEISLYSARVTVIAHAEYETKVFDTLIPYLAFDVPYKGYGPKLKFMEDLGWSIHDTKLAAFP